MRFWMVLAVILVAACDDDTVAGSTLDSAVLDATTDGTTGDLVVDAQVARLDMARPDMAPADMAAPDMQPVDMQPVDMMADAQPADMRPVPDMLPDMLPDMAVEPDQGAPVASCTACATDRDCADDALCTDLIDGRRCVRMCSAQNPDVCGADYNCVNDLCLPAGARCDSCTVQGCPEAERCDPFTGNCAPKAGRCDICAAADDCVPGLNCVQLGMTQHCLPECAGDGMCPAGLLCIGGTCAPLGGVCDACGGCPFDQPLCNGFTGECIQCGLGVPCLPGFSCDLAGQCQLNPAPGVCNADLDCNDDIGQPRCAEGMCAQCLDGADCPAQTQCMAGVCEAAGPCAGVSCQAGTACDPADGLCRAPGGELGCAMDVDCGDMRACNAATGQCYRSDQRCDDDSVCAPGSECRPDPFDMNQTVCTCVKTNIADAAEVNDAHRVPCQPGGVCLQFTTAPGVCIPAP